MHFRSERLFTLKRQNFMTGKLIAQKLERKGSARLIQQKDGSALYWVCSSNGAAKQTVLPIRKEEIEQTIKTLGLQLVRE